MPTDPGAERRRILSAGGPRTFQEFRRLLSPRVRALKGYIRQTVACSPTFYAAVAVGLNTIPDDYHDFLARNGRTIWMGDHLVNMDPSLKGQTPQGWPPGSTWAEVSGAYQHHHRRAMLAERVADRKGTLHMARDVPATVREEIGARAGPGLGSDRGRRRRFQHRARFRRSLPRRRYHPYRPAPPAPGCITICRPGRRAVENFSPSFSL